MNTETAFEHFLSQVAPAHYNRGTIDSWKSRYVRGKLSTDKIRELLLTNSYTVNETVTWSHEYSGTEFIIIYLTKEGIFLNRVICDHRNEALQMTENIEGYLKGFYATELTLEQILKRINEEFLNL